MRVPYPLSFCASLLVFAISGSQLFAAEAAEADEGTESVQEVSESEPESTTAFTQGRTEMLPLWELGIGGIQVNAKDYPGSDQDNNNFFALPYFIYRGEKLRVDDEGVSAIAVENSRFSLDFSLAGAADADSDGNSLREGLPDIDFLFEIGPQLIVTLYDNINSDGSRSELTFATQARAAFSTDFSDIESLGGVLSTALHWQRDHIRRGKYEFGLFAELTPKWATHELHELFYEVEPEFATATRPAFDAGGGYMGTDAFVGITIKPQRRLQFLIGYTQQFFSGAANEDSPLFETSVNNKYFAGFLWEFKTSKKMVPIYRD